MGDMGDPRDAAAPPERTLDTGEPAPPPMPPRPPVVSRSTPVSRPAPVSRRSSAPHRSRHGRAFRFSGGDVLTRTFGTYFQNFPFLFVIAFLVFVPATAWMFKTAHEVWSPSGAGVDVFGRSIDIWQHVKAESGWVGQGLDILLPLLLQATVTLGVLQVAKGDRTNWPRSAAQGFSRFAYVLGVGLVLTGIMLGFGLLLGLLIITTASSGGMAAAAVVSLGLAALMLWITTIFLVAPQVAVVERVGPFKALARSAFLTSGARWKVFGILLLIGIVQFVVVLVLQKGVFKYPASETTLTVALLAIVAVTAALSALQAVMAAVLYHDLRRAKEGVGVEELIKVFA